MFTMTKVLQKNCNMRALIPPFSCSVLRANQDTSLCSFWRRLVCRITCAAKKQENKHGGNPEVAPKIPQKLMPNLSTSLGRCVTSLVCTLVPINNLSRARTPDAWVFNKNMLQVISAACCEFHNDPIGDITLVSLMWVMVRHIAIEACLHGVC